MRTLKYEIACVALSRDPTCVDTSRSPRDATLVTYSHMEDDDK